MERVDRLVALREEFTFGIEIETKDLTNEQAAEVIAQEFGTRTVHEGGYYCKVVALLADGRKWTCMADASLSGTASEIVSPICRGTADIEMVQRVVRALRRNGATVDSECGIHIHIGADRLGPAGLANLVKIVDVNDALIRRMVQLDSARSGWCSGIDDTRSGSDPEARDRTRRCTQPSARRNMDTLARAWYGNAREVRSARSQHYHESRYHNLNLHSVWFRGTVEFRYFNGTLHAGKVRAWITLVLALAARAAFETAPRRSDRGVERKDAWTFIRWLGGAHHVTRGAGRVFDDNVKAHLFAAWDGRTPADERIAQRRSGCNCSECRPLRASAGSRAA